MEIEENVESAKNVLQNVMNSVISAGTKEITIGPKIIGMQILLTLMAGGAYGFAAMLTEIDAITYSIFTTDKPKFTTLCVILTVTGYFTFVIACGGLIFLKGKKEWEKRGKKNIINRKVKYVLYTIFCFVISVSIVILFVFATWGLYSGGSLDVNMDDCQEQYNCDETDTNTNDCTDAWNRAQIKLQCCGVRRGYIEWEELCNGSIPLSCCETYQPMKKTITNCEASNVHNKSCLIYVEEELKAAILSVSGVQIIVAVVCFISGFYYLMKITTVTQPEDKGNVTQNSMELKEHSPTNISIEGSSINSETTT